MFSALIGSISFSGSLVAFAKLQELLPGAPITFPGQQIVNALLFAAIDRRRGPRRPRSRRSRSGSSLLLVGALVFGVTLVLPIGGADMPVVISFLNAFTGLAAAATGFVLANNALIIGGTLVGASGTLLTILMGKAMNRSLANVLFGAFGAAPSGGAGRRPPQRDGQLGARGHRRRRRGHARLRATR